jgi:hypothetical protein
MAISPAARQQMERLRGVDWAEFFGVTRISLLPEAQNVPPKSLVRVYVEIEHARTHAEVIYGDTRIALVRSGWIEVPVAFDPVTVSATVEGAPRVEATIKPDIPKPVIELYVPETAEHSSNIQFTWNVTEAVKIFFRVARIQNGTEEEIEEASGPARASGEVHKQLTPLYECGDRIVFELIAHGEYASQTDKAIATVRREVLIVAPPVTTEFTAGKAYLGRKVRVSWDGKGVKAGTDAILVELETGRHWYVPASSFLEREAMLTGQEFELSLTGWDDVVHRIRFSIPAATVVDLDDEPPFLKGMYDF